MTEPKRRDWVIASLVCKGLSNADIAKRLRIQEFTVKERLAVLYKHFDITAEWNKKARLVYVLWKIGLLETL